MPNDRCTRLRIARGLATAVLAGSWSSREIATRLGAALRLKRERKWQVALANRIVAHFGSAAPPPTQFRLVRFIVSDAAFEKCCRVLWCRSRETALDLQDLPRAPMSPAPAILGIEKVPPLTTPGELARWLELEPVELEWLADCRGRERQRPAGPLRHYRYVWLRKKSGKARLLEIPKQRLKAVQRRILDGILAFVAPHEAAHAFRAGHSTVTCASPHVGQRVVLRIDLRDFFPSIPAGRVQALFRTIGYPEPVARLLAALCTNSTPGDALEEERENPGGRQSRFAAPHLPQGAPSSPAVANLCTYRLDCRLAGLARKIGLNYTRYADDLVFSGGCDFERNLSRFRIFVCAIVLNEGFSIRRRKTRVMRSGARQEVAGVIVNRRANVSRDEFDRLKALLFNCGRSGPAGQNRAGLENFREHLLGRVAYVAMIHPQRGARLHEMFERIDWSEG